jgi:hypothetical protein
MITSIPYKPMQVEYPNNVEVPSTNVRTPKLKHFQYIYSPTSKCKLCSSLTMLRGSGTISPGIPEQRRVNAAPHHV